MKKMTISFDIDIPEDSSEQTTSLYIEEILFKAAENHAHQLMLTAYEKLTGNELKEFLNEETQILNQLERIRNSITYS